VGLFHYNTITCSVLQPVQVIVHNATPQSYFGENRLDIDAILGAQAFHSYLEPWTPSVLASIRYTSSLYIS
jgi:hypothetical protein